MRVFLTAATGIVRTPYRRVSRTCRHSWRTCAFASGVNLPPCSIDVQRYIAKPPPQLAFDWDWDPPVLNLLGRGSPAQASTHRSVVSSSASPCTWLALRARLHRQVLREPCECRRTCYRSLPRSLTTANGCTSGDTRGTREMWGEMHGMSHKMCLKPLPSRSTRNFERSGANVAHSAQMLKTCARHYAHLARYLS